VKLTSTLWQHMDPSDYPGFLNVFSSDEEAINALILLHAPGDNSFILDCTYGLGHMWADNRLFQPDLKTDLEPKAPGIKMMDFTQMDLVEAKQVAVIIFDPPHLSDHGATGTINYQRNYGVKVGVTGNAADGGVTEFFPPFLKEAYRVLCPRGIVLCKIIDMIHSSTYLWQHTEFMYTAWKAGFTVRDLAIKKTSHLPQSSTWVAQHHLRNAYAYWICVQKPTNRQRVKPPFQFLKEE